MNQFAKMQRYHRRPSPAPRAPQSPRHRVLQGKIHVAKKELGLSDDDYQAVLIRETGLSSTKEMSEGQLVKVVEAFVRQGWQAKPQKASARRAADNKMAKKARALWISLHQLGAINNPDERALEAFAARQLGCERMQWADQSQGHRLIEALKAIAERAGWDQSTEGVSPAARVLVLKRRLVTLLFEKLKAAELVPASWDEQRAAFVLGGLSVPSFLLTELSHLDLMAQVFGQKLRMPIKPVSAEELGR